MTKVPTTVSAGEFSATLVLLNPTAVGDFVDIRDGNGEDLLSGQAILVSCLHPNAVAGLPFEV